MNKINKSYQRKQEKKQLEQAREKQRFEQFMRSLDSRLKPINRYIRKVDKTK